MDIRTVVLTMLAIFFLGIFFASGYDIGRRSMVVDIDSYGCEKVITTYHRVKK